MIYELYDKGLLCHCQQTVTEQYKTESGWEPKTIALHWSDCPGKMKMMEMLRSENGEV